MIDTDRLRLRPWRAEDHAPFLALCRDRQVMRFIGPPQTADEVSAAIARQQALQAAHGHCFWAVERHADGTMIGFCGLKPGPEGTPLQGAIEIGWRLARDAWGQGYAHEAAAASLRWGFDRLGVDRIGAITVPANERSFALMRRLGMVRDPAGDSDHPLLPPGHALRRHLTCWAGRA